MFEKIYKVDSREFKNTYYYYTEIFKQTSNLGIETPQLVHEIIGGKLAVLYFDFIEIQVNNENVDYLNLFLKFDSLLKKLPPKNVNEIMEYQLFISSSTYQRGKRKIIVDFPEGKRQSVEQFFTNIEKYFMTQKLWFQHIDFHLNNVVNGVFLIDWDTASYYPENYDLGTILSRPIFEKIKNDMHNSDLFKKNIQASNNGKRNVYLEFSIFLHFARFYPEFNFSELFQEFINDYRDKFSN